MKYVAIVALGLACSAWLETAAADPWKDESGHRRWRDHHHGGDRYDRDRKLKFYTADGCEVERKWKKGEYEEKIKCKLGGYRYRH